MQVVSDPDKQSLNKPALPTSYLRQYKSQIDKSAEYCLNCDEND
jgi:hypothetical protein